jgi:hypothetical protein
MTITGEPNQPLECATSRPPRAGAVLDRQAAGLPQAFIEQQ